MNRKLVATAMGAAALSMMIAAGGVGVSNAHDNRDRSGNSEQHGHSSHSSGSVDEPERVEPIGRECAGNSDLNLHSGFQSEDAVCVATEFGEQSGFDNNPSLLIVDSPGRVRVGEDIVLEISTRNLVRDRFLAAGDGGYYLESAFLNEDGLTRGHFHTGCRRIGGSDEAPEPFRLNGDGVNRFVATEDGKGGAEPDTVRVVVEGFNKPGLVQCAAWAGDGSHRIPMMSFANQIPAFDVVRVQVVGRKK